MLLYRIFILLYRLGIGLTSFFRPKARQWIAGRQHLLPTLAEWRKNHKDSSVIWMHCASLGEFEQGRSLLEQLRAKYPQTKIVLSFYSPSGYEMRKDYDRADYVTYLPLDTPKRAYKFVETLRPDLAIFVKYEFWYYHLRALFASAIPTLLVSAVFRPNQFFFRWYGKPFFDLLQGFTHIFVQDPESQALLAAHGLDRVSVAGDTRIDRSSQLPKLVFADDVLAAFAAKDPVLVVGSSWPADEAVLFAAMTAGHLTGWRTILVPHEIGDAHLLQIEAQCPLPLVRYSHATPADVADCEVLLLDTIGMLSKVYRYGKIAYIGGGFGSGIHNTLEPIAYGLPVLFGPNYQKFIEARRLVKNGGGFSIDSPTAFLKVWQQLQKESAYRQASTAAHYYVKTNVGATDRILDFIENQLASTSLE